MRQFLKPAPLGLKFQQAFYFHKDEMKLFSLITLLALTIPASAATISISTGVAPWLVNGNPAVNLSVLATPVWINNFGDGRWVGSTANDGNPSTGAAPGTYIFTLNLGTFFGGPGSLSLQYAADNSVNWTITNGSLSGNTSCGSGDCFLSSGGAPRSLSGIFASDSVLTATVLNGSTATNPMGLIAVGTASDPSAVPEPSTFAMLAFGGLLLAATRHRKA
jgi:hypothetical protein